MTCIISHRQAVTFSIFVNFVISQLSPITAPCLHKWSFRNEYRVPACFSSPMSVLLRMSLHGCCVNVPYFVDGSLWGGLNSRVWLNFPPSDKSQAGQWSYVHRCIKALIYTTSTWRWIWWHAHKYINVGKKKLHTDTNIVHKQTKLCFWSSLTGQMANSSYQLEKKAKMPLDAAK